MSTITKLVLASHNKGKAKELKSILEPYGIELVTAGELSLPDVEETGETFADNAILKADNAAEVSSLPSLSDDSGICVDALGGRPGVYSARYGDYNKLLGEMKDIPSERRDAHFMCVLALKIPGKAGVQLFEGRSDGFILSEPRGEGGFGYDPVFLPEGEQLSFAEMLPDQKHDLSHRGRALNKFISYLKGSENA